MKTAKFNELVEGQKFMFPDERIPRYVCQIGKTEMYCPKIGQNTIGHSMAGGEEVYLKSDKPVLIGYTKHKLRGIASSRHIYLDGVFLDPAESQKACNLSPDGFNWGYHGAGATLLALAIVLKLSNADDPKMFKLSTTKILKILASIPTRESFEIEFEFDPDPEPKEIPTKKPDIRVISIPADFERVETGALQFGPDWPGLFIRGDNAGVIALELDLILTDDKTRMQFPWLHSLRDLIKNEVVITLK